MPNKQGPKDPAETAFHVFQQAIGEIPMEGAPTKSEAAVNRGKARAAKIDAGTRTEIARAAAKARWAH